MRPSAFLPAVPESGTGLPEAFALVHGPLAHWSRVQPGAIALSNGVEQLTFAQLHARVEQQAQALRACRAPATVLLEGSGPGLERIVEFLAVIASGRCAAVADPDWPAGVQARIAAQFAQQPAADMPEPGPETPFYIGFTSGSSGLPKGFRRHHRSWAESFRVSAQDLGAAAAQRVFAPGRLSHSLFLFAALLGLWSGAGVEIQERFSAGRALARLQSGTFPLLVAVPSQLQLMLEWAQRRAVQPIDGVALLLISGARWMRERTPALQALFPKARIVEFYGASEASYIAWMQADPAAPAQAVGRPFSNVELHIGTDPLEGKSSAGPGLIWVRSPMLFMDYVGHSDGSAALRRGEWLSVRDIGHRDAQGRLHLLGRESRMLVTQGKNLFPEEVEARLQAHPALGQVSLHGVADGLRGHAVHAVLQSMDDVCPMPDALALAQWCRETLEAYKAPRQWWLWQGAWPLTASGKTDHAAIARALADPGAHPLQPWP
ncbi:AMP-binding protein [Comamonas endophytica]|uniref:AMP-binding protein n=1 Tax=Comamonas endophytica TaxID=2949090 RepID=A0ABY6G6W9_9BURK|nr:MULTISPECIES: AMP-binding protein [unclassified Acidovorax]MCD2511395.1 AMP-binding protein [Acidovorax sp. D4N7]UYG50788.1 AMP-binding protein [Acidovorax sp. 5MLIR]